MSLLFKRFVEFAIITLLPAALIGFVGCQGLSTSSWRNLAASPDDPKAEAKTSAHSATEHSKGGALSATDREVFARGMDKDSKGRSHSVWIRNVDATAEFRWHYPKLEEILARPADSRPDLHLLLTDEDQTVAANAAIALARCGDSAGRQRLVDVVRSPEYPLPARCAAVEALANLKDPKAVDSLKELLDQYGRYEKIAKAPYIPELHTELIRGLARHERPASNSKFIEALRSPSPDVRLEALKAYSVCSETQLPTEAADLRTDGDYRIRSTALEALASHKHPQAAEFLSSALLDTDSRVHQAAIAGLGALGTAEALASLEKLLKDPNESVRAKAVEALTTAKVKQPVLEAAGDKSWRVRRKVADALAVFADHDAAAAAVRMLDDNSSEVQLATVRSLEKWPLDLSGPILLTAMSKPAFGTRKAAAEQLHAKWPPASAFPVEGPVDRRAQILKDLNQKFRSQFIAASVDMASQGASPKMIAQKAAPNQVDEVDRLIREQNLKALADYGPSLIDALEQLQFNRKLFIPESIYREVLPKYGRIFAVLDQLSSGDVMQRRRAAEELLQLSAKQPPARLVVARLTQLAAKEDDALVLQYVLRAISDDGSQPAIELAYIAIGHASAEVRRRACEHLAAHPDQAHTQVLIPALADQDQGVVCAAVKALAAIGTMPDPQPLRRLLGSANEDIQIEAALALTRLHDPTGKPALERLAYSRDPTVRARTAEAMGEFPDPAFTAVLIYLLNDKLTVSRAALNSLPKVVGEDVAQANGQSPATTTEQMLRWKHWHEHQTPP